jgi:hypothetical protein
MNAAEQRFSCLLRNVVRFAKNLVPACSHKTSKILLLLQADVADLFGVRGEEEV